MKKTYLKNYLFLLGLLPLFVLAQEQKIVDVKGEAQVSSRESDLKKKTRKESRQMYLDEFHETIKNRHESTLSDQGYSGTFEQSGFRRSGINSPKSSLQNLSPSGAIGALELYKNNIESQDYQSANKVPICDCAKPIFNNNVEQKIFLDLSSQGIINSDDFINVLDISADGNRVVIGAEDTDSNGLNAGIAIIYENLSGDWVRVGDPITGEASGDNAGYAVSISGDGNRVAVASLVNNLQDTTGYVRVFQNNAGGWEQVGQSIQGSEAGDDIFYRESVSLNQDGSVLAFSSENVHVYRLVMDNWMIDADTLVQGSNNVSLSADGNKLIAGSSFGTATLCVYDGTEWSVADIATDTRGGFYGFSVDISLNGQFVGVGSVFDGVYLYEVDGSNLLHLLNYFMSPTASSQFGWDVSVENTGTKVAVSDNVGDFTEIYSQINEFWYAQDRFSNQGNAVSFEESGAKVALGGGNSIYIFGVLPDQNTSVSSSDSLALVDLYEATSDSGWFNSTNWLDGPVFTWNGITVENNQVTEINLGSNNLSGSLPASIGDLRLTSFNVNFNQLNGSIPSEIGNWTDLTYFDVRNNQLIGPIPETIGNLTQLTNLELFNNQLSGEIPEGITRLTNLVRISAGLNEFTGTIPAGLGNLSDLTTLYFWGSNFIGTIPSELGTLSNLRFLSLQQNQLSGEIPTTFGNLTNMEILFLYGNNLTGEIPSELGNLNVLETLDLGDNILTGEIPQELGNLSTLSRLELDRNDFGGTLPTSLSQLINLETLNIRENQINGLPDLSGLTALTFFDVSFNRIPNADIALNEAVITLNEYQYLPILESDSLALVSIYNVMGGEFWNQSTWFNDIAAVWEGVGTSSDRVTSLDLDVLGAFGEIPNEIADLDAIQVLDMSGTGAESINQGIQNFDHLFYLDVSSNRLTFDDLSPFADFISDTTKTLIYSSQSRITDDELIVVESPSSITASVPAYNGASYLWFNDSTEVPGTSNTITFDLATDNRANLRAEASHPNFPELILSSGTFRGRVNYFNTEYDSIDPYFSFDVADSVQFRYRNSLAHDFDQDGFDDLLVLKNSDEIAFYRGSSTGLVFEAVSNFQIGERFYQDIHMGDLNGDGVQDVVVNVIDSLSNLRQTAFLFFDGSQPFGTDPASILLVGTEGIYNEDFPIPGNTIGDVDGDGSDEFFFGTIFSGAKGYLVDIATDFSISYKETTSLDYSFGSRIEGLGDITGDGIDDFAVSTFQDDIVAIFRGNSSGNFATADFSMPFDANHIRTGDFNGDEFPDVAISYFTVPDLESDKLINIYYGGTTFDLTADASFNVTSQPMNGEFELELTSGSLEFDVIKDPTDGGLDDFVFFTPFGSNGVMVEMEKAEESMIPSLRYNSVYDRSMGRSNSFVNTYRRPVSGDFNGDGIPDIVVPEADTTVHIYSAYINVAPEVNGDSLAVNENSIGGTSIGALRYSDANGNADPSTLAITAGNTNDAFSIVDGEIQIADSTQIDFEVNPVFQLTISMADKGGLESTGIIIIKVNDINETPLVVDASVEVNELLEQGTEVLTLEFSDPEEDALTLSIAGGNTDDAFAIDDTGLIIVNNADAIDIDTNPTFSLIIEVSDQEFTATGQVEIQLLNVNEIPVISDASFEINGRPDVDAEVGIMEFTDPDGDELMFSITEGNNDGIFVISESGVITVANPEAFTSNEAIELTIEANDGELSATAIATITLNDVLGLDSDKFGVYPNPSNGVFNVENLVDAKGITAIEVTDLSGKPVSFDTERISSNHMIVSLKTDAKGIFILRIETDKKIIIKKVTKI